MAKQGINVAAQCRELIAEIQNGQFRPIYLLMGEEAYYPDMVCQAIIDNCIDEFSKDFNETICYGADVTADQVISAARQFPMMADRVLVVVREAQLMKNLSAIWDDIVNHKIYIMGGCGALYDGVSPDGTTYNQPYIQQIHQAYGRQFQLPQEAAHTRSVPR